MNYLLISRCERTHDLFRLSWIKAIGYISGKSEVWVKRRSLRYNSSVVCLLFRLFQVGFRRDFCIITFGVADSLWALCLPVRARRIVVITGLGRLGLNYVSRTLIMRWFWLLQGKHQFVVLNSDDYEMFRELGFKRLSMINGEGYVGQDCNTTSEYSRYVYVGRLLKSKGVDKVLTSYQNTFSQSGPVMRLIGDSDFGNRDSISETLISSFSSYSSVIFEGYTDQVSSFLDNADVYISLSKREGLPFGVLDALHAGCIVVLSDVPGHKEFRDMPGVILLKDDELDAVFPIIESRVEHFEAREDLKEERRELLRKYNLENVVNEITEILNHA